MYKSLQDVEQQIKLFESAFENYVNTSSASTSYLAKTPANEFDCEIYKIMEKIETAADTQLKIRAIELMEKVRILISEIHITEKQTAR